MSASSGALFLGTTGWLGALLEAYLDAHDPAEAARAVEDARRAGGGDGAQACPRALVERRVGRLDAAWLALPSALAARVTGGASAPDRARAGALVAAWDVLLQIAALHENRSSRGERKLELLAIMALWQEDLALARRLHAAHLEHAREPPDAPEPAVAGDAAAEIERRIQAQHGARPMALDHPIAVMLARLEVRAMADLGSLYFERATIEEEGVARLHVLTRAQKVDLILVLIALAWADGRLAAEERRLIATHVELAALPQDVARRLLARLEDRTRASVLELEPLESGARRFILEQAVLLALVDDELHAAEQRILAHVARALGGSELELEAVMVEVSAYYEQNRDALRDFGPISGALGRLRNLVLGRARAAVKKNALRILQEVRETGELAKLLGAASVRKLTAAESAKVKAQVIDICKAIPALALFVLPGGALLLPVLFKVLPFNLLPTAFADERPPKSERAS